MKTLRPIRPSAAMRAQYQRRLDTLIEEMHKSILYWLKATWRKHEPSTMIYGQDASPVAELQKALNELGGQWQTRFDELAGKLAKHFATSIKNRCEASLKADLRAAGVSVKFTMTPAMHDALNAVIGENVNLIQSIASQHLTQVETMVMQSVSAGRDLKTLTSKLEKQYGVTKRRAATIARDQNNKATTVMRVARESEIGVTEGIWRHSSGGKHPRESHKNFNGKRFNLAEGHDFGDGFGKVRPGEAINCRCFWTAIIPMFED